MKRALLIIPIIPFLSACGLDELAGKQPRSPEERAAEAQIASAAIAAAVADLNEPYVEVLTEVDVTPVALIVEVSVTPPCYDEFRVRHCVNGVAVEWDSPQPEPAPVEVADPLPFVVPVVERAGKAFIDCSSHKSIDFYSNMRVALTAALDKSEKDHQK